MGYRPPKTVYKLDFSETEYAGLEVTVRSAPIGQLLGLEQSLDDPRGLMTQFSSLLVSWNVEDDEGAPVPASFDGVMAQEPEFIREIVRMWRENITQAPPPLPGSSPSGGSSAAASTLGLAEASKSLPS